MPQHKTASSGGSISVRLTRQFDAVGAHRAARAADPAHAAIPWLYRSAAWIRISPRRRNIRTVPCTGSIRRRAQICAIRARQWDPRRARRHVLTSILSTPVTSRSLIPAGQMRAIMGDERRPSDPDQLLARVQASAPRTVGADFSRPTRRRQSYAMLEAAQRARTGLDCRGYVERTAARKPSAARGLPQLPPLLTIWCSARREFNLMRTRRKPQCCWSMTATPIPAAAIRALRERWRTSRSARCRIDSIRRQRQHLES